MTAVMRTDELPEFEGQEVEASQIRITNAGDGLSEALKIAPRALHHGDDVAILIRGKVTQINHKTAGKGEDEHLIRVHTISATAATELEMDHATKILTAAADNLARRKAEIEGQQQLAYDDATEGQEIIAARAEQAQRDALDEALAKDDE